MHDVDEMAEAPAEPVEFPDDQCVAVAQRLEAALQPRTVVEPAARGVAVDVALGDAGGDQRVSLQVEHLGAVGFRDAHVADKRGKRGTPQTVVFGVDSPGAVFAGIHITKQITSSMLRKR